MSRRYTVICHRCGKSTFVDLTKTVSDQRCRACHGFLQGVDVSIGEKKPKHRRKLVIKFAGTAGREPEWADQETPIVPIRQRWPRYYKGIVIGGIVAFLLAVGQIGYIKFRDSDKGSRPLFEQEPAAKVDVRVTERWRREATALAKSAMAARTADELLPHLYHPEVDADGVRKYYATRETLPLGSDLVDQYYIPPGNYTENVVAFLYTDGAKRNRAFVVVEKPDGMKIDWPSLVGLGEMSVEDYVRTAPSGVVVLRARARVGHYYNDYFSDSRKWLSIRLSDVTDDHVIHGYFNRALPRAAELEQLLPDPENNRLKPDEPVIVTIKYPAGNVRSEQTEIVSFVAMTWYIEEGLLPIIEQARKLDANPPDSKQGPLKDQPEGTPKPGSAPGDSGGPSRTAGSAGTAGSVAAGSGEKRPR